MVNPLNSYVCVFAKAVPGKRSTEQNSLIKLDGGQSDPKLGESVWAFDPLQAARAFAKNRKVDPDALIALGLGMGVELFIEVRCGEQIWLAVLRGVVEPQFTEFQPGAREMTLGFVLQEPPQKQPGEANNGTV